MAALQKTGAGILQERPFGVSELDVHALALGLPTGSGVIGLKLWQAGFSLYREQLAAAGYAMPLGRKLQAAVSLGWSQAGGQASAVGEAGLLWKLIPQVRFGLHLVNPFQPGSVQTLGLYYQLSQHLEAEAEWRKEMSFAPSLQVLFRYHPSPVLLVTAGLRTAPIQQFGGAAVTWRNWQIGISAAYHALLGISPGVLLVWGGG
ncbi:hypothetical protein ACWKWU_06475 [Chitinophaga lutea]